MVMNKKIMDWIAKPGSWPSLRNMEMKSVIRHTAYDQKNTGEKVRCLPPGRIADMGPLTWKRALGA